MGKKVLSVLICCTVLIISFLDSTARAQDPVIHLSINIPEYYRHIFVNEVFAEFEDSHPNVKINIVTRKVSSSYPPAAYDLDAFLRGIKDYARSADLLFVDNANFSDNFSIEATRTGFFRDLSPLVSSDSSSLRSDFYEPALASFVWDGKVWALPVVANLHLFVFDPDKFDEVGAAYPSKNWSIDDFATIVRKLMKKQNIGTDTVPGFVSTGYTNLLFRSWLASGFYDSSTFPETPRFAISQIEPIVKLWLELEHEGTVKGLDLAHYSLSEVPLRIDRYPGNSSIASRIALLPGDQLGVSSSGFAISAGSKYPELAYSLLEYLTGNVKIINELNADIPARKSISTSDNSLLYRLPQPEAAILQKGLEKAIPFADLRYSDYLLQALDGSEINVSSLSQKTEQKALTTLNTIEKQQTVASSISVATPIPTVASDVDASLRFDMIVHVSPLPNRDLWDKVIKEFTETDTQIRQIVFNIGADFSSSIDIKQADCFYSPFNITRNPEQWALPLNPLVEADPAFDSSDFIGNALAQFTNDNKLYAVPISIAPRVILYDKAALDAAGIATPTPGWTIRDFESALQQLQLGEKFSKPFIALEERGLYLQMLIAAYGGLPIDYRTTSFTVNFVDPKNVSAIKKVLDLAKEGLIAYRELRNWGQRGTNIEGIYPVYSDALSDYRTGFHYVHRNNYSVTTFPQGKDYTVASYDTNALYINPNSNHIDACYRWISTLRRHPELFPGMPTRKSVLNDSAFIAARGEALVKFYKELETQLTATNLVVFPAAQGTGESTANFIVSMWLYRTFDSYIFDNGDLETMLSEAQQLANSYMDCIPKPEELSSMTSDERFTKSVKCGIAIDPSMQKFFYLGEK